MSLYQIEMLWALLCVGLLGYLYHRAQSQKIISELTLSMPDARKMRSGHSLCFPHDSLCSSGMLHGLLFAMFEGNTQKIASVLVDDCLTVHPLFRYLSKGSLIKKIALLLSDEDLLYLLVYRLDKKFRLHTQNTTEDHSSVPQSSESVGANLKYIKSLFPHVQTRDLHAATHCVYSSLYASYGIFGVMNYETLSTSVILSAIKNRQVYQSQSLADTDLLQLEVRTALSLQHKEY